MTLQVIGAGFGRTGIMSVYIALNQLGFPCYHMTELLKNKNKKVHLKFWCHVADSEPGAHHDWEQVFSGYSTAVDNPACCVWRELLREYPHAQVLLTLHPRGARAWYDSTAETIYFTERMWQFKLLRLTTPFARRFEATSSKLIWQRSHQGTVVDRDRATDHYRNTSHALEPRFPPSNYSSSRPTKAGPRCANF